MIDYSSFPIDLHLSDMPVVHHEAKGLFSAFLSSPKADDSADSGEKWEKATTLFKEWTRLDTKKTM
jgi:hypothetical protein